MARFTLEDLKSLMRSCAGVDENVDLDSDIGDTPFQELGYDSLAVLEIAARIEGTYGVHVSDDEMAGAVTPRYITDLVDRQLTTSPSDA